MIETLGIMLLTTFIALIATSFITFLLYGRDDSRFNEEDLPF